MVDLNKLAEKAKELGASAASAIRTSDIRFSQEFRKLCEQNSCGKYGTNWMCPPAIGTLGELKAEVLRFSEGVVFQTVHKLKDSFDFEGMKFQATLEGMLGGLFTYSGRILNPKSE